MVMTLIQNCLLQFYPPTPLSGKTVWKTLNIEHLIEHEHRLWDVLIKIY